MSLLVGEGSLVAFKLKMSGRWGVFGEKEMTEALKTERMMLELKSFFNFIFQWTAACDCFRISSNFYDSF
jgi:hypothetical protein